MTEDSAAIQPADDPRCTWCSAELPDPHAATCPSCGATLIGDGDPQVPGVTALDAEAIVRAARAPLQRPRSRLLRWISGEYEEEKADAPPVAPESLAPPPIDVQREMLRLELAAEVANLEAEADAIVAEAEVEAREAGQLSGAQPADTTSEQDEPPKTA
jgi:hypothetical protein